jgi:UDP-N-acetylmuramate--alanine ligase
MVQPGAHVHLIGIGGSGLSAIAAVLLEQGYTVSGCDQAPGAAAEALAARGVRVWRGHAAAHLDGVDAVVITSAAAPDLDEIVAARARGLPVLKRADFLGELMDGRAGVAVAGTHGKTTTTGMIAYVLARAGLDPTFIVGGTLRDLGVNAHAGHGAPFVIEADEYDRMFLGLRPRIAVVTNVEHDHPDIYPAFDDMRAAFAQFVALLADDGLLVACAEDPEAQALGAARQAAGWPAVLYGFTQGNWRAHVQDNGQVLVWRNGFDVALLDLAVPGRHNVLNALAALAVTDWLGVEPRRAAALLGEFHGMSRRFEVRGEAGGVTVIDDYGHHPTEIRATLAAARERYPGRALWAVWQPHTYSRTATLLDEFAAAFGDAAHVIVTDIYASREHDTLGVSAAGVVARMRHPDARHIGPLGAVADYLVAQLAAGDVLIVLSAGDAPWIAEQVLQRLGQGVSVA